MCYNFTMQEKLFYLNSKGEKLCAVLSGPAEDLDRPIIVLCHGFAASKESGSVSAIESALNSKAISTFKIDLYGHGESEGKFENVTVTEAVDDIIRAINYLKSKGYSKVGLAATSFSGLAGAIAAAKNHDLFVLVLKSPVSDYTEILNKDFGEAGLLKWKHEGISQRHGKDIKYSFVLDAEKNNGYEAGKKIYVPTLIVHGDADEVVPVEQSKKLASIIPGCNLEIIKGANHRYTTPGTFDIMISTIINFIVGGLNN